MRRKRTATAGLVGLAALVLAVLSGRLLEERTDRPKPTAAVDGQVVAVIDGDTIGVMVEGKETRVRLFGIDAPEKNQPYGADSKRALSEMVFGHQVQLTVVDTDRYGRLIGRVRVGDRDVNLALVETGAAWWYQQYAQREIEFSVAEQRARAAKIGLWAGADPVPPWKWRKR